MHLTIDTGNALLGKTRRAEITVQHGEDRLGGEEIDIRPDGFAETIVSMSEMPAGKYHTDVVLRDPSGRELGKVSSDVWELPKTPWLGNRLGITDKIQPPWKPIGKSGLTLTVWGREYQLAGGFGLPQQIVSQGRELLARPVALELVRGGRSLALTNPSVEITRHEPHAATWSGRADAEDVRVRLDGLPGDVDGMMLLTLTLEPLVPGKAVKLDSLKLHTVLPRERALFLNTSTDQGYWWYPYKSWLPDERGGPLSGPVSSETGGGGPEGNRRYGRWFYLRQHQAKGGQDTSFLFFVVLGDHDVVAGSGSPTASAVGKSMNARLCKKSSARRTATSA